MKKTKKIPNINARDFATILNINPYQNAYQLLEDKIEKKYPFFGNKFTLITSHVAMHGAHLAGVWI